MSSESKALTKKVVVTGDPACGKTSLLSIFFKGIYPRFFVPPIIDKLSWLIDIEDKDCRIIFLDTNGNDGPNSRRPYAYLDADAAIICFSIGSKITLENVQRKWVPELHQFLSKDTPIVLLGLKKDLRHDLMFFRELRGKKDRMCRVSEGRQCAEQINAVAFLECSAKKGEDLRQPFVVASRAACGLDKLRDR